MLQNEQASVVALAKQMRMGIDPHAEFMTVPSRSLDLVLRTLIELVEDTPMATKIATQQAGAVAARIAAIE
jgi:hypothetical protein